jgi:hypothetical protein
MNASMQYFQNALAYFATAVSYIHKMFLKLSPGRSGRCRDPRDHSLQPGINGTFPAWSGGKPLLSMTGVVSVRIPF